LNTNNLHSFPKFVSGTPKIQLTKFSNRAILAT
jgi:hypothetical protein